MLTQSTTPYDDVEENSDNDGSNEEHDDCDNVFNSIDTSS